MYITEVRWEINQAGILTRVVWFLLRPRWGAKYCDEHVCLSTIICSELHVRSSPNVLRTLPMAVARSSSGGVVMHYVLRFCGWRCVCSYAKVARRRHPVEAQCTRSLGLGYKLCAVIPVAGQRTHRRGGSNGGRVCGLCLPCLKSAVKLHYGLWWREKVE